MGVVKPSTICLGMWEESHLSLNLSLADRPPYRLKPAKLPRYLLLQSVKNHRGTDLGRYTEIQPSKGTARHSRKTIYEFSHRKGFGTRKFTSPPHPRQHCTGVIYLVIMTPPPRGKDSCKWLVTPAMLVRAGEIRFSPVAPGVLRQELRGWGEGDWE